jgi:hypothetical protein
MIRRKIVQVFVFLAPPAAQEKPRSYWPWLIGAAIGLTTLVLRAYLKE